VYLRVVYLRVYVGGVPQGGVPQGVYVGREVYLRVVYLRVYRKVWERGRPVAQSGPSLP